MNPESNASGRVVIIPRNEGPVLNAFGDTVQVKLGAEHTGGKFTICLSSTPPGVGPPPHRHVNEDELFLIIEGRYEFLVDGEWIAGGPGDVAFMPRGCVHTFRNGGETTCRTWIMTNPSGFETFFGKCSAVFGAEGAPDMPRILGICAEHGIEFVPPLGPPA